MFLSESRSVELPSFVTAALLTDQYSDTPALPLVPMTFTDKTTEPGKTHTYRVIAVNTVGLRSK